MSDRSDSFLREVDEAVRQEHYKKLWDEYGIYALGLAVLVIAGVAAYKGWTYWQERQAQAAGAPRTRSRRHWMQARRRNARAHDDRAAARPRRR